MVSRGWQVPRQEEEEGKEGQKEEVIRTLVKFTWSTALPNKYYYSLLLLILHINILTMGFINK